MNAFDYCIPTKIVFGDGTVARVGEEMKPWGTKIMMISYDRELLEKIGIYDIIMDSLKVQGMEVVEVYGVKPNPTVEHVRACAALAKERGIDALLAVGGGSVIDSAKFIVAAARTEADPWDFFSGKATISDALPLLVISTIPATSSEMNSGAVLTNEAMHRKEGMYSPFFFPKVSILDPTVTYSIPARVTAYSMADAMSHVLEGYLTHRDENAPLQDGIMEALMKSIISETPKVLVNPADAQARAVLMWSCALAWNGFPVSGVGAYSAPMHIFGHSLSALYDVPHGASLSVVMPHVMRYDSKTNPHNYAKLARRVFGITESDDKAAAKAGIEAFQKWLEEIGAPVSFAQAGIPDDNLQALVDDAALTALAWGVPEWTNKDKLMEIYKLSR